MTAHHEAYVDAAFPLRGDMLPLDHGYALLGALSRHVPALHSQEHWSVHPVQGRYDGPGRLALTEQSRVKIRLPAHEISQILGLTGQDLELDGHACRLGVPTILPLIPAPYLKSRLVTINRADTPEAFLPAVRRLLARVPGLGQDPERIEVELGSRRVLRVKGRAIFGHAVAMRGFEAQGSLAVQRHGIGGRHHMGAGVFVPPRRSA